MATGLSPVAAIACFGIGLGALVLGPVMFLFAAHGDIPDPEALRLNAYAMTSLGAVLVVVAIILGRRFWRASREA